MDIAQQLDAGHNNQVFGFFNGSEQFPTQSEDYSLTYIFGLRRTNNAERGSIFKQS